MSQSIDPSSYRSPDPQRPAVPLPIEREPRAHDPYAAFRFGDFALFTAGNLLSITGRLMLAVAVEWEIYDCARPRWSSDCRPCGHSFLARRPFGGPDQSKAHHPCHANLQCAYVVGSRSGFLETSIHSTDRAVACGQPRPGCCCRDIRAPSSDVPFR